MTWWHARWGDGHGSDHGGELSVSDDYYATLGVPEK